MPGRPLDVDERDEISQYLREDQLMSWVEIGRRVERDPTTIAREVNANGGRDGYRPAAAQRRAERNRARPKTPVLVSDTALRERITGELRQGRSPEAIWADLRADPAVERVPCVETIYQSVYRPVLDIKPADCLRTRRRRRRHRQARCESKRPSLPNISARPEPVNDRSEPGHWEADQIIGKNNRSSMLWLSERVTRYSIGITMPLGYDAEAMVAGLVEACEQIPPHLLKSITFDQGSEWANWETIAATYGLDCWFCDPHAPWQRGQIENLNRQWRWWFPRGTDLSLVTPTEVDHAAQIINHQRRRSMGYESPAMRYAELLTVH